MKKSKFLILPLLCCMGLVGCKEDEIPVPIGPFKPSTTELERGEGSLLSTDLVKANAEEFKYETKNLSYADLVDSDEYEILDDRNEISQYGVLVVRGENGRAGFYSVLQGKFLMSPKYDVKLEFNYYLTPISNVGFVINVVYTTSMNSNEYEIDVFDSFGNRFNLEPEYFNAGMPQITSVVRNEKLYLSIHFNPTPTNVLDDLYYQYEDDGSYIEIDEIPEAEIAPEETAAYEGPSYNSLFKEGWLDLKDYGLEGYSLAYENGYYTVFNNDKAERNFYMDPKNNFLGVVAGDAYFQKTGELIMPQEEYVYDYSIDEVTYSLEQYRVDLLTGEKTKLNYGVVFDEFEILKSHDGVVRQVVSFKPINERLLLGEKEEYIVDKDFKLHDCVSGVHLGDFIKYKQGNKDRFYNTTNEIIYNDEFQVLTYLSDMNPIYKADLNMFQGTKDGKKGLVDLDGKVRLEFKYTEIVYDSFKDNVGLAKIDNEVYRVDLSSGNATLVGYNLQSYFGDDTHSPLYSYSSSDDDLAYNILYSADKEEGAFANAKSIVSRKKYLMKYNVMFIKDLEDSLKAIKYSDFEPQDIDEYSYPSITDGSYERPIELSLDNEDYQKVYTRAQEDIYVKLDPDYSSENGYYFVTYNSNYVEFINDIDPLNTDDYMETNRFDNGDEEPVVGVYVTTSHSAILHFHNLQTGNKYNRYHEYFTLKVEKALGSIEEHPFEVSSLNTNYTFRRPSFVDTLYPYYVTFTASESAAFYINVSGYNSIAIMNGEEEPIILPDINCPIRLANGASVTLRVRFTSNSSTHQFSFGKEACTSTTYNAQSSSNILKPTYDSSSSGYCSLFFVTFSAQQTGRYQVDLQTSGYNISRLYADYSATTLQRFNVSTAPKTVTLCIKLSNSVYVDSAGVAYTITRIGDVDPSFTISFDNNGGTGSLDSVVRDEGATYYLPDNPFVAPEDYYFIGWKINNQGDLLNPYDPITITANITLYAQWAEIPVETYTINLNYTGYASNNYAWYEETTGTYKSSNSSVDNSASSMAINILASGTLSFEWMNYGEGGCDYLAVIKNSGQSSEPIINGSQYHSSSFTYFEISVSAGDVITFTYVKDGSVSNSPDCARIRNISFEL